MSGPPAQLHSAVMGNERHTPQQQQQQQSNIARSPVAHASPRHVQHLAAPAASASPVRIANTSSGANGPSPSSPSGSSHTRMPLIPEQQQRRAASGSLDRLASLPSSRPSLEEAASRSPSGSAPLLVPVHSLPPHSSALGGAQTSRSPRKIVTTTVDSSHYPQAALGANKVSLNGNHARPQVQPAAHVPLSHSATQPMAKVPLVSPSTAAIPLPQRSPGESASVSYADVPRASTSNPSPSPASAASPQRSRAAQAVDALDTLPASGRVVQPRQPPSSVGASPKSRPLESQNGMQSTNDHDTIHDGEAQPARSSDEAPTATRTTDVAVLPSIDHIRNRGVSTSKNGDGGEHAVDRAKSSSNSVAPEDIALPSTSTPDPRGSTASSSAPMDYETFICEGGKAKLIPAVSCLDVSEDDLEQLIIQLVETQGEPLVITDLHKTSAWDADLFHPHKVFATVPKEELYGKDRSCYTEWSEGLAKVVHRRLVYRGQHDVFSRISRGLRHTQFCRFDQGGARTPLKRGLCSSLLQNLMIWSDPDASAVWFITNPEDTDAVDEYLTKKGGSPHFEGYIPPAKELTEATFSLSFWRQRVGDLVLVPPRASYMVMNSGGRTVKTAWSRLTVDSLVTALFTDLPLFQRRCQRESHHIRSVIEHTVIKYTKQVGDNIQAKLETPKARIRDLSTLLQSYDALLSDEYAPDWRDIPVEGDDVSYVECDVCGADTLHGFFECKKGDTLCVQCYCQGRLCPCSDATDSLRPYQLYLTFGQRLEIRNQAAQALLSADPTLALTAEQRANSGADDEDDEPPLLQVELLKEEDVGKRSWPLSFLAATNLYKLRQTTGWRDDLAPCRICKATLDSSQRYFCKPCGHSYCFGCLLHKLYIHPAHVLAQNEPKLFHSYHKKASTLDYKEWKQDPFEFRDEARAHFALIEAARTNMKCVPQVSGCRIGFLDVSAEHKHGLSGTLGVTRPTKSQTDKVKAAAASSSPASTPVSRKRIKNSSEAPSAASPKSPSRKKVRIEAPRLLEPMDEGDGSVPTSRAPGAIDVPGVASAPVTQGAALGAGNGTQTGSTQPVTSFPTVANGIRKFVLREGKAHPVSPVIASQPISTPPSSSPAMSPSIAAKVVPSQPLAPAQAPRNGWTHFDPTEGSLRSKSGSMEGDESAAANVAAALAADKAYRAELASTARSESATVPTKSVGGAEKPTLAESGPAPAQPGTASGAVRVAQPSSSSSKTLSPPAAVQAQAADQNTLALATSVVAAGITSDQTVPAAASPPTAGLGSLDPMTLRVVTEVLRIYSQANEKKLEEHVAQLTKGQVKHAQEQTKAQQANAQMQATLLQRVDQLSSEVKTLTQVHAAEVKALQDKHELEVRKLRQRLDDVARQQTASNVRVDKLDDKFQGLFDDIDRQAQAALQAELSTQSSQAASSGQVMSGDHFVPLSNAR